MMMWWISDGNQEPLQHLVERVHVEARVKQKMMRTESVSVEPFESLFTFSYQSYLKPAHHVPFVDELKLKEVVGKGKGLKALEMCKKASFSIS